MSKKIEPKSYESAVKQLQVIIDQIEESEISLKQMMELYEQGKELVVYCEKQLNKFEEKIQVINLKNQEKE